MSNQDLHPNKVPTHFNEIYENVYMWTFIKRISFIGLANIFLSRACIYKDKDFEKNISVIINVKLTNTKSKMDVFLLFHLHVNSNYSLW